MSAAESLTAATTGGRNPFHIKISGHRGGEPVAARKRIGRMPALTGSLSLPLSFCAGPQPVGMNHFHSASPRGGLLSIPQPSADQS